MNVTPPLPLPLPTLCLVISVWKAIKHFLFAIPVFLILPTSFFVVHAVELIFEVNVCNFPLITFLSGQKSKPDQNKINWLESASDVSPTPALIQSVFHLAFLPFPSPPNRTPTGICICIYSFTYSFTLDFLWIISFTPPFSSTTHCIIC